MKFADWKWVKGLAKLLGTPPPEPTWQAVRIAAVQLHIVLPAKLGVIAVVLYYLFYSSWFDGVLRDSVLAEVVGMMRHYFVVYIGLNFAAAVVFLLWRRFPPGLLQWVVFSLGLLDGIFMTGVTFVTGGFESIAYWIFPGLIVLNALSIPLATPQIVLNLLLSIFYLSAGILGNSVLFPELWTPPPSTFNQLGRSRAESQTNSAPVESIQALNGVLAVATAPATNKPAVRRRSKISLPYRSPEEAVSIEPELPKIFVLWLLAMCCYGVQVLLERQRRAFEEMREFSVREGQLRSAGRLAAEIAHQIKNPLAIINNAAFSMQRALKEGRYDLNRQIEIIQEEVDRSDRIVTQIMGYAQLTEGRVERLNVAEELDRAIEQVFPAAVESGIRVERSCPPDFPPLFMQQRHLSDILVNILQNAREALGDKGAVNVTAVSQPDDFIQIVVADDGPGIARDKLERVFEAYYTTKERGTGLGLSIVKHNAELYAGTIRAESELGKGARFILTFPAKAGANPATQR